jgi:short-subunit dehydrogenase
MKDLKKTVLITGASGGIGYELAKLFAEGSYNLVLVARSEERLNEVATELQSAFNIEVTVIAKDLFEKESPFEIYDEVNAKGIEVHILVNDAAQGEYGEFSETDIYRELDIIQLNVGSVISLTKLFLRDMIERNEGKILNVGSIAGEAPGPWQAVYHGTKAFIHSWSAAIRNELKDTQIQVTVLVPGATDTDFFHKANMEDSKILETKLSDPAEVARDGYNALLAGEDKRVSGMKNKVQVTMGQVMSDSMAAENMKKQQEPKNESE